MFEVPEQGQLLVYQITKFLSKDKQCFVLGIEKGEDSGPSHIQVEQRGKFKVETHNFIDETD